MSTVAERFRILSDELAASAAAANRPVDAVSLVCVSKTVGLPEVRQAFEAGARIFGENRIESMMAKASGLPEASWHFIGNIQGRKIPDIVRWSDLIHSVWRADQLPRIARAAQACDKVQDILIEVNVSGEASKDGLEPGAVPAFLAACETFEHLRVRGLMTMAPQGDPRAAEETFRGLAELKEDLVAAKPQRSGVLTELSMGMSEDWKCAVSAGSTMVRLGRAVFAPDFC